MKYEIIKETEIEICVKCIDENGDYSLVHRLKQPPNDYIDWEAEYIIKKARAMKGV